MATGLEVEALDCGSLRGAALSVEGGRCVCVSGASGSGKSRLLRAIADLDPNAGQVRLDGRSRESYSAPEWRRRVMLVPSESAWWADAVGEHLPEEAVVDDDLAALGFTPEVRGWSVERLSSGERQRLALVRAVARLPRVLLLDEPTANMDVDTAGVVESWLIRRRHGGLALLWVSHDPDQIRRVGDRHLHIRGGRLEAAG